MNPLVELSALVDPAEARHPEARQAIVDVTRALRKLLKADRWPRPFQIVGIAYCALAGDRVLLADDMGLGKGPQALCRILLGAHVPAIVVCPASMLLVWKEEAGLWAPGVPFHRLDRVDKWVPPPGWRGIVVTTWDLLRYHSTALARMRPRIVVGDECHALLHEDSERSIHFEILTRQTPHLLLLSGTPLLNRARDVWRLLNLLDERAWPEHTKRAFKEMNKDDFDRGVQTRLTRRVRQYMLRRQKVDALTDLTAKKYQTLSVRLPPRDMLAYQQVERAFADWLYEKVRDEVLSESLGLGEEELEQEIGQRTRATLAAQSLVQFGHLRRVVGRRKVPLVTAWVGDAARSGEPVGVFAEHQEVVSLIGASLARWGLSYGVIDGKTPKTRRYSLVKEFQTGKIVVLLASQAAKEGLTLTKARHVLFAERFLTAAAEDQAADRLHRIGQKRDVCVWIMCALGTIDERVDRLVGRKRRIAGRTVDAGRVDARAAPR